MVKKEFTKVRNVDVQYEAKFSEVWYPIVRYDYSHGFLHRDIILPGGKKGKYPLDIPDFSQSDPKQLLIYNQRFEISAWIRCREVASSALHYFQAFEGALSSKALAIKHFRNLL